MKTKRDWCSLSPETLFGKDVSIACKLHDYAYWELYRKPKTPENIQKRKEADIMFKELIKEITGSTFISWVYYIVVRMFGGIGLYDN